MTSLSGVTEYINDIPVHPVASLFPMIGGEELQALADDIKANGQREPIIVAYLDEAMLDEPVVIDGRNRFAACELAGVEPEFKYVMSLNDRELSPQVIADWIISHNLHRRHLTTSQKAMVGQGYLAYLKEEAKKRQLSTLKQNVSDTVPPKSAERSDRSEGESAVQAAKLVGVGKNSIRDADFVVRNDPELAQQVRDRKVTVSAAAKRIRESLNPKPEQTREQIAEKLAKTVAKHDEETIRLTIGILKEILGENG